MKLDSMYQDVILDHYRNPHGKGLRDGDAEVHHVNPTCGDEITLRVRLGGADGQTIEDVSYASQGCSISQASASVLNDLVVGHTVAEALATGDVFLELMQSRGHELDRSDEELEEILDDGIAFAGVAKYPARVKCALLSWMALKDAASQAVQKEQERKSA
ncbi:SUF system NifU family Fe-S cluster assembly protein [Mangrovactinospora gilvigrisea]|uniref:SUF system NifU family Fe-S cluster assembly protein n=1 Tax=Mangrovactinospora gilvigrisea TaxID=1428644 RepID=A0A1J7BJZ4_9ACTN|nr:SUF system NifU family Fe-S cluster assembly protein [Mangrovactinospora gilvigrisea]OIV38958.1 SUF system NifU family Fe-S cluster assembly protein [Mangrovactinospora gilvigrisea]